MDSSFITQIGTAIPPYSALQPQATQIISEAMQLNKKQKKVFQYISDKTNIDKRHSVLTGFSSTRSGNAELALSASTAVRMQLYEKHALNLALNAINQVYSPDDIKQPTHLITVSCTGMYAPGLGIEIIDALKLPPTTQRSAINFMGCYALFPALRLANAICKADKHAKVLIVCVELCTLHLQGTYSKDTLLANALFSDGASALMVEQEPTGEVNLALKGFYCNLITDKKDHLSMAWHIRDMGFDIKLSSYVPKLLNLGIPKLLSELLSSLSESRSNIDYYAIHPGGKRILETVEKCLSIDKSQNQASHEILQNYGNMSSVTLGFVFQKIMDLVRSGKDIRKILSMAFGPGLTLETGLIEVHL